MGEPFFRFLKSRSFKKEASFSEGMTELAGAGIKAVEADMERQLRYGEIRSGATSIDYQDGKVGGVGQQLRFMVVVAAFPVSQVPQVADMIKQAIDNVFKATDRT